MKTWFTSDEHYDHRNIIKYCGRPFADIDDMRERMISMHNEVVSPEDVVWHLGDFCLNARSVPEVLPRLNGRHYLVVGNHDAVHPMKKSHANFRESYMSSGFVEIVENAVIFDDDLGKILLSHMPYTGDPLSSDRYSEWRPVKTDEKLLLHGHVHEKWRERPGMLNVGVDVWNYRPVSLEEIKKAVVLV